MPKIGRNDPCPCGSGKKYKKCCMRKDEEAERQAQAAAEDDEEYEDEEIDEEEDSEPGGYWQEPEDWDEPELTPEEEALYDASDRIYDLMDEERYEDAAREFLSATEGMQDVDAELDWTIIDLFEDIHEDNPDLAIEVMQRAMIVAPGDADDWQAYIVSAMIEKGDLQGAFSILHKAVEDDPDHVEAWLELGRRYLEIEDYENAEKYLKRAIEVGKAQRDEDIDEAYMEIVDLYIKTGQVEEAMQAWEKAYQYDDECKRFAADICGMLVKNGELERALNYINWIPNSTARSYYIGKIRQLQGDEKKALYYWNSVLDEADDMDYSYWPEVAFKFGRYNLIIENLESFLKNIPRNKDARVLLSLAFAAKNDMGSARKTLEEAPRGIKLTDEHRSWCDEYLQDEKIRDQWLKIFMELYPDNDG